MKQKNMLELSWEEVGKLLEEKVASIIGRNVECVARMDDYDYWALSFGANRISLQELELLFQSISATDEDREETLSESKKSVNEFGMELSIKLLRQVLDSNWEVCLCTPNNLLLIGVKEFNK